MASNPTDPNPSLSSPNRSAFIPESPADLEWEPLSDTALAEQAGQNGGDDEEDKSKEEGLVAAGKKKRRAGQGRDRNK